MKWIPVLVSGDRARQWTPYLGGLLWTFISVVLTIAGIRQMPAGGTLLGAVFYAVGLIPGLLFVSKLPAANDKMLAAAPTRLPIWNIFIGRFWIMMFTMMGLGQLLRFLPLHPWFRVGFYLFSASALLCGAVSFLIQSLSPRVRLSSQSE